MPANTISNYSFQPNDENVKLWRYMDFAKFVSMISTQTLYFTRADKFIDKFEGAYPIKNIEKRNNSYNEDLNQYLKNTAECLKYWTYINCWHMNEYESAGMWELYGNNKNCSIAIETIYSKLKQNLPFGFIMSCVKYIDYRNKFISEESVIFPFLHKRKSFEHEKEVRIIIQDERLFDTLLVKYLGNKIVTQKEGTYIKEYLKDTAPIGIPREISLDKIINKIHISPLAPMWFFELVKKVVQEDYKLNIEVKQSNLYQDPIY